MLAANIMVTLARQALRLEQQLEQLAFQEVTFEHYPRIACQADQFDTRDG